MAALVVVEASCGSRVQLTMEAIHRSTELKRRAAAGSANGAPLRVPFAVDAVEAWQSFAAAPATDTAVLAGALQVRLVPSLRMGCGALVLRERAVSTGPAP